MTVDSSASRFTAIFDTMRDFRLSNMVDEDNFPYCLVDAMTRQGLTIEDGEEQMHELAAEIVNALDALTAAPASAAEPFAWYWFDEHGCLYITGDARKPDVPAEAEPLYTGPTSTVTESERQKLLGIGMAMGASVIMQGWGDTVHAKEILGAAGFNSEADLVAGEVDEYDINLLRPIFAAG